jgi:hypothetical protein
MPTPFIKRPLAQNFATLAQSDESLLSRGFQKQCNHGFSSLMTIG